MCHSFHDLSIEWSIYCLLLLGVHNKCYAKKLFRYTLPKIKLGSDGCLEIWGQAKLFGLLPSTVLVFMVCIWGYTMEKET